MEKRFDDQQENTNRRFDTIESEIKEVRRETRELRDRVFRMEGSLNTLFLLISKSDLVLKRRHADHTNTHLVLEQRSTPFL